MRKCIALFSILILLLAACGGNSDDEAVKDAGDAETCEDVANLTIGVIQGMLDEMSDMSVAELQSADQMPEAFQQYQSEAKEIRSKGDELGCSTEQMQTLLQERVDQLEAEGPAANAMLKQIQNGMINPGQ